MTPENALGHLRGLIDGLPAGEAREAGLRAINALGGHFHANLEETLPPPGVCVIETCSGVHFELAHPDPSLVRLSDIGWSLSRLARFTGHTTGREPYSVGQHSAWCAAVGERYFGFDSQLCLQILLHDAHEAYTTDISTPVKKLLGRERIRWIQNRIQTAIHESLSIPMPDASQKEAIGMLDGLAVAVESYHTMPSNGRYWTEKGVDVASVNESFLRPLPNLYSYRLFLEMYKRLVDGLKIWDFWREWEVLQAAHPEARA